jgi:hypothetical protein
MIFVSLSIEKNIIPCSYRAPLSQLTSCTPTKSNLRLANSLAAAAAAAVIDPALYRLLTFQVPSLFSPSSLLMSYQSISSSPSVSVLTFHNKIVLRWGVVSISPNPQACRPPLSAVRGCLFNIFTATLTLSNVTVLGIAQEKLENLVAPMISDEGTNV